MLDELIDICSRVLCSVLDINNVIDILQVSEKYNAYKLKDSCIQFICSNLVTLIENGKIDILNHEILYEIQTALQQYQNKKFKFTRGENSYYKRIKNLAEDYVTQKKIKEKGKRSEKKNRKGSTTNKENEKGKEEKVEELWQPSQEDIQEQILIYQLAMAEKESLKNNSNSLSSVSNNNKKKKKSGKGKEIVNSTSSLSTNAKNKDSSKELYDLSFVNEIQNEIEKNSAIHSSSPSTDNAINTNNINTINVNNDDEANNNNSNKLSKSKKLKYSKLDLFSSESSSKGAWETVSSSPVSISKISPIKITNQTLKNSVSPISTKVSATSPPSSSTSKGWAILSNIDNDKKENVLSFKEIMKLEQQKENSLNTTNSNKNNNSFKGFQKLSQKERKKASKLQTTESVTPTEKVAWGGAGLISNKPKVPSVLSLQHRNDIANGSTSKKTTVSNNPWANRSFITIQQEQLKSQKEQQKKLNKSLAQIQTEERAIDAILSFYKQTSNLENGEWFSVTTI